MTDDLTGLDRRTDQTLEQVYRELYDLRDTVDYLRREVRFLAEELSERDAEIYELESKLGEITGENYFS